MGTKATGKPRGNPAWKKGGPSANPKGRPRRQGPSADVNLAQACREYTVEAINIILDLARTCKVPAVKLRAAMVLLERGHGMPMQPVAGATDPTEVARLIQQQVAAAGAGITAQQPQVYEGEKSDDDRETGDGLE